ncbi:MAG: DUF4158 domain-containing protein [Bacteroidota bacterium]
MSTSERDRLARFPTSLSQEEVITYFTLTEEDIQQVTQQRRPVNRLGYALQLCIVRFLGFVPSDLLSPSEEIVTFLADQLVISSIVIADYGSRVKTPSEHLQSILSYLG